MTMEFDAKGKFFTEVVSKIPVHVTLQTTSQLLRGNIHVRQGERLKDELDRDEYFLAMTEAVILGTDGKVIFETPFLAVSKSQIVWGMPDKEVSKE
jgi:hypothetical protein